MLDEVLAVAWEVVDYRDFNHRVATGLLPGGLVDDDGVIGLAITTISFAAQTLRSWLPPRRMTSGLQRND